MTSMTWNLAIVVLILTGAQPAAQAPSSALAKVEQRLTELLTPGAKAQGETLTPNPPPRKPSRLLDKAEVPLHSAGLLPPAPPRSEPKSPAPRSPSEDTPLVRDF